MTPKFPEYSRSKNCRNKTSWIPSGNKFFKSVWLASASTKIGRETDTLGFVLFLSEQCLKNQYIMKHYCKVCSRISVDELFSKNSRITHAGFSFNSRWLTSFAKALVSWQTPAILSNTVVDSWFFVQYELRDQKLTITFINIRSPSEPKEGLICHQSCAHSSLSTWRALALYVTDSLRGSLVPINNQQEMTDSQLSTRHCSES